jgi:hypothetical protein
LNLLFFFFAMRPRPLWVVWPLPKYATFGSF